MIADLGAQEFVDGGYCAGILSDDPHLCTPLGLFIAIADRLLLFDQDRDPGHDPLMDGEGSGEVATGERPGDLEQVGSDGLPAFVVSRIVRVNLDDASIGLDPEVVGGAGVVEPHDLVAPPVELRLRLGVGGMEWACRGFLSGQDGGERNYRQSGQNGQKRRLHRDLSFCGKGGRTEGRLGNQ